ncbi:hypothetical protein PAXINDRAFT_123006 [Paxillus involutus ATCC 200175]|nr:hypothetical protein PAXINDRAFT_123006 [Paxillus involutus ATCC 200175]
MSHSSSHLAPAHPAQCSSATSWGHADPSSGELKGAEEVAEERRNQTRAEEVLSPTPPLTRTQTDSSVAHEGAPPIRVEDTTNTEEEDIADTFWHPLRDDGKVWVQNHEEDEGGETGSVRALGSIHDDDRAEEGEEKERPRRLKSSSSKAERLRLEFKPASPLPWDTVDRPGQNNDPVVSDYYSTLNSKNFAALQKNRRRPLIPHSSYYFGPPPPDSAYGTPPVGQIGVHHPRDIIRIERDYAGGELVQFAPVYPLELEGRIPATRFLETINDINEILISAHSIYHSLLYNALAVFTLQLSTLLTTSHYTKEMRRLERKIAELNTQVYNPVGLNILWPQKVAFLFVSLISVLGCIRNLTAYPAVGDRVLLMLLGLGILPLS